jgi:hypothetical protein
MKTHYPHPPGPGSLEREMYDEFSAAYAAAVDLSAHLYAHSGHYLNAAALVDEGLVLLARLFRHDRRVSRERVKLGLLLFNAGDLKGAYAPLLRGVQDLQLYVGEKDLDI